MSTPFGKENDGSQGKGQEARGSQLGFSFESPVTRRIWTVGDLVSEVRQRVEREYGDLWVEGEISNLRSAPSGHIYFTLKDGDAQLPAVLFRRQASLLRFKPADGLHVLRRMAGKGQSVALTSARVRELQGVFDERMRAAHTWR